MEESDRDYKHIFHGRKFADLEEAVSWAKATAKENKFSIIRSSTKKWNSGRIDVSIQCQHSGKPHNGKSDGVIRRVSTSKKCGCTFHGRISTLPSGEWVIIINDGHHTNHAMIMYEENIQKLMQLAGWVKKSEELTDAHVKPQQIKRALQLDGDDCKTTHKQIYNIRQRYKLKKADWRTPIQMFAHLTNEATRYKVLNDTLEITCIFLSNPECISLLCSYSYVVVMDSTYNNNRYNYALLEIIGVTPMNLNFTVAQVLMRREDKASYMWALECLCEIYGENMDPTAIVTDRELGLMEPIRVVIPRSANLLCLFHIKKMVEAKVLNITKSIGYARDFMIGRFLALIESPTVETFCDNHLAFQAAYQHKAAIVTYIDSTWIVHKEKFVNAWTNGYKHFGNTTSNRAESAHSVLKTWLGSSRGGIDTLFGKIHPEIEGQITKIRRSLESSRTRVMGGLAGSIFKELPTYVTHRCIRFLRTEFIRRGECCCAYQVTHGLPCSSQLRALSEMEDYLQPQNVHEFWQTLEYGDDREGGSTDAETDELDGLLTDLRHRDKADQFLVTKTIRNVMYPEDAGFGEPTPILQTKGRPKKKGLRGRKNHGGK